MNVQLKLHPSFGIHPHRDFETGWYGRMENYEAWVGRQVRKRSGKPFKSGSKVNTIKTVVNHPVLARRPAFTFIEDDSAVECRICDLVGDAQ